LAATWKRLLDEARGGSREEEIERARRAFYEGFVAEEIDRFSRGRGLRRRGDRPLLARGRWPPGRTGPGRMAGDARTGRDLLVRRHRGVQDRPLGARPCLLATARALVRIRRVGHV